MRALYSAWGADVVSATNRDALLAALGKAERCPDLIVADYRLAQGELGTEVIAQLREEMGLPIPALLISGHSGVAVLSTMHALRCEVLVKPVLPAELRAASERLLAGDASTSLGLPVPPIVTGKLSRLSIRGYRG